ncbi:MAG TPA: IS66 family insertion sequence element accessory protein TnpB [Steroidobacteraceae bacterium]|jgi:transposase|nr:IS66 family insertion sequence element accessory protein TnpB [Steroidobacteraceae bacterium]
MLQITPQMKILVAVEAVDFRKGIDGLVQLCKESLQQDPFAGAVFVFRNRRSTALKALVYDGQGFWLCHKRLSNGRFRWWPSAGGGAASVAAHQLSVLFAAGNPDRTAAAPDWRPVGPRS